MNSAVMSRRGADGATGRGGTRTSLFGSIAEEIGALQSAADFNHGKSNFAKTTKRMDGLGRNKTHRGVSGGEAWAEKAIRAGRPETCDVQPSLPEHFYRVLTKYTMKENVTRNSLAPEIQQICWKKRKAECDF